jgi:hypothetical protein
MRFGAATPEGDAVHYVPLSEDLRDLLKRLQRVFAGVYPLSLEEWEEGFRRDAYHEEEMALWPHLADVFEHFTRSRQLDQEQKQDILRVALACMNKGKDHALLTTDPRTLSRKRVREIANYFFAPRR